MPETNSIPSRKCTGCKNTLLVNSDNFHVAPLGKYGFKAKCKTCCQALHSATRETTLIRNKEKYNANKAEILAQQKAYYHSNKIEIQKKRRADLAANPLLLAKKRAGDRGYYQKYRSAIRQKVKEQRAAGLIKKPVRGADHYAKIRDATLPYMRKYREANREKLTQYQKKYKQDNWPELLKKKQEYQRANLWVYLRHRIGTALRSSMKKGEKAGRSQEMLLGYTRKELAAHLESLFTEGMTWEKFMKGEIHIDHVIPVSYFRPDSADSPEFKACWALSNLQPLWATDNLKKGAKLPDTL